MGSSPEEFSELRRLLALKRAEQPPPGYFNTFAGKVTARIEAEGWATPQPWWSRMFMPSAWAPGLAGANTAIVAGLAMLGGTAWYIHSRPAKVTALETAGRTEYPPANSVTSETPTAAPPTAPQYAGFGPLEFGRPSNPHLSLVQLAPMAQFQIREPSVRDRVLSTDTDAVPRGIFEPWNTTRALPTSIVHYVESPRP